MSKVIAWYEGLGRSNNFIKVAVHNMLGAVAIVCVFALFVTLVILGVGFLDAHLGTIASTIGAVVGVGILIGLGATFMEFS